ISPPSSIAQTGGDRCGAAAIARRSFTPQRKSVAGYGKKLQYSIFPFLNYKGRATGDERNLTMSSSWTPEQNKVFETALAMYDENTPDRWQKVARAVGGGKTVDDVKRHCVELYHDLHDIVSKGRQGSLYGGGSSNSNSKGGSSSKEQRLRLSVRGLSESVNICEYEIDEWKDNRRAYPHAKILAHYNIMKNTTYTQKARMKETKHKGKFSERQIQNKCILFLVVISCLYHDTIELSYKDMKGPGIPTGITANSFFVLVIVLLVTTPSLFHHCLATRRESHHRHPPAPTIPPLSPPSPPAGSSTIFNVLPYGAVGDGTTDDSKASEPCTHAFATAWSAACGVTASTVMVPASHVFLVGPIAFTGDSCQSNMAFQVYGTILAPGGPKAWRSGDVKQWLEFKNVRGLAIQGSGTVDGQGSHWWSSRSVVDDAVRLDDPDRVETSNRPTALRVFLGENVTVTGITIRNSPKFHLTFDTCRGVEVHGVAVSSPGDSPNTDGIHLAGSIGVSIRNATIACGDDCVSIQGGCSDVYIRKVNCGPGHGISIGGLGKGGATAVVSEITVEDVTLNRTTNGVRIKTWQGGSGSVKNVRFTGVRVAAVRTPVVIDLYYCDQKAACGNRTSAVAVSGVAYRGVAGTYTERPVYLACSDAAPCSGIHLDDIRLAPAKDDGEARLRGPFCWKAYGDEVRPMEPPVDCLMAGTP
ncbi:hypothetical protein EJB05_44824, partial [Eragrostis curvula]